MGPGVGVGNLGPTLNGSLKLSGFPMFPLLAMRFRADISLPLSGPPFIQWAPSLVALVAVA